MNNDIRDRIISSFGLTPKQQIAAFERNRDVVVTAGAGSGKTRTLVARYASLLADGCSPRNVAAITFTKKAAREMRSRVRQSVNDLARLSDSDTERQHWVALNAEMDSARIGTIHSLCTEILRAHPAEAGIDPKFDVIDEGLAAVLQAQIVEDTMAFLVGQPEFAPLFSIVGIDQLSELLAFLLDHRLETQEAFSKNIDGSQIVRQTIETALQDTSIKDCISELHRIRSTNLIQDAGDKLAIQVEDLLDLWGEAEKSLAVDDFVACARSLYLARRNKMKGNIGSKTSRAKEVVSELQSAYDRLLNPIIGGEDSKDQPPDAFTEASFIQACQLIKPVFEFLSASYKEALRQRRVLDFNDLENKAAQLLQQPEIQARWQHEITAVLVDEFQDTNERQRNIVESLAGSSGRLFVVGDARQSIYRFRNADVTVFRSMQQHIMNQGGLVVDLDETYRAHEPLLNATGDLLQEVMGIVEDPSRPYYVPFTPLRANRKSTPEYLADPHIELVLGAGEDAASARPLAARALAIRLLELKNQGQIRTWDDVTLLLKASSGFAAYENAFEEARIPFVTVAGRGFYDRPEIRDVINILKALADPADDLAMAGLLRSPAFGLTDTALYQLRWQNAVPVSYWSALQGDLSILDNSDMPRATRCLNILKDLLQQVDRISVSELLKKLVDATDYRAVLAANDSIGVGGRLWRNLDKLLADAQTSGQVNVRDFIDYINAINDVGAREGEAPAEAQGSVRLMTIHKSKGLEFPIVVLADASREPRGGSDATYLIPNLGLAFKLDPPPMLYRLAKWQDQCQNDAETQRLLYVALTRAKDKLIINGHVTSSSKGDWTPKAWLSELCAAAQIEINTLLQQTGTAIESHTISGHAVRAWSVTIDNSLITYDEPQEIPMIQESEIAPIYAPLSEPITPIITKDESIDVHSWRATGFGEIVPPGVIGQMVHKAIELWLFPNNSQLISLLETAAQSAGLSQSNQRMAAIKYAIEILARLQNHFLREEIESATQRFHEMPYSRMVDGSVETGYIDLLYESQSGWQIVDFKTDSIRSATERAKLIDKYANQIRRYTSAVETLIGQKVQARICFLDDNGQVGLVTI